MSVIGLKKANCKNCYKCLKVCPVKSIRVVNEQAQIIDDDCLLCGTCLAGANFVMMMVVDRWLMHKPEVTVSVALVVCLTLLLTVVCAKIVGCTLPMAAEKVGIDPAVMAAPFITTIVDALSLLIYFTIATRVLGI